MSSSLPSSQEKTSSTGGTDVSYTQFACIGTGVSGICLGATLARWYGIDSVRLFSREEAGAGLGGTWAVNRYPGVACDVPSVLYSLSFETNPDWSRVLPAADELETYLARVADKYDLTRKMVFGTEVVRCEWVEEAGRWRLWLRDLASEDGALSLHECQFLFSGAGHFGTPRPLDLPGTESFAGPIFHSSRWRDDVDLRGKKVVLFGNGSTAAQIVPTIVGQTKHLTQIGRSKHWVFPPIDAKISDGVRAVLRNLPWLAKLQRLVVFAAAEEDFQGFAMTKSAARFRERRQRRVERYMRETAPEKYHDMLIPDFEVGCKRRIFDSGYLASLHAENFTLTDERPVEVVPTGVRMPSGEVIEADVIVLASGFITNRYLGGVKIVGRGGETLAQHWNSFGGPEAYNCTAVSGFPNLFFLLGPNTATGHTSTMMAVENAVNYALRVLKPVLEGHASIAAVKRSAEEGFVKRIQKALQDTVWMSGCNSWYIRGPGGKTWNGMSYPWSQAHFWYSCLFPVWKDWEYTGTKSRSTIVKRRRSKLWLIASTGVAVAALLTQARSQPGSYLASFLSSPATALPELKTWVVSIVSKVKTA